MLEVRLGGTTMTDKSNLPPSIHHGQQAHALHDYLITVPVYDRRLFDSQDIVEITGFNLIFFPCDFLIKMFD